ncbi:hypothetical protein KL864_17725 [Mycolicibacterium goodii]|nr:hypothetical protein [Mycolicibacterium goodii]
MLGGLAVVLAIALAVVVTVLVVRPDSGGSTADGRPDTKSGLASARDTGPVEIITDDPTCDAWTTVLNEYSKVTKSNRWDDRDSSVPESAWTADQRAMYKSVGSAMTRAADQAANLMTKTPHRVMRVLYEQFVAYTREFVDRIPSYTAADHQLSAASNAAGAGIANICGAISLRSAQAVAPLVPPVEGPTVDVVDRAEPTKLLVEPNAVCGEWDSFVSKFNDDTATWRAIDKDIPATEWTPDQRAINESAAQIMSASADEMVRLGRESQNPELEDIITLAAQYRRGFVIALPNYTSSDSYLELSATSLIRLVNAACKDSS